MISNLPDFPKLILNALLGNKANKITDVEVKKETLTTSFEPVSALNSETVLDNLDSGSIKSEDFVSNFASSTPKPFDDIPKPHDEPIGLAPAIDSTYAPQEVKPISESELSAVPKPELRFNDSLSDATTPIAPELPAVKAPQIPNPAINVTSIPAPETIAPKPQDTLNVNSSSSEPVIPAVLNLAPEVPESPITQKADNSLPSFGQATNPTQNVVISEIPKSPETAIPETPTQSDITPDIPTSSVTPKFEPVPEIIPATSVLPVENLASTQIEKSDANLTNQQDIRDKASDSYNTLDLNSSENTLEATNKPSANLVTPEVKQEVDPSKLPSTDPPASAVGQNEGFSSMLHQLAEDANSSKT